MLLEHLNPDRAARDEEPDANEVSIGSLIFGTPKKARGCRTVTFTPKVAEALSALVVGKSRDEFVFATPTASRCVPGTSAGAGSRQWRRPGCPGCVSTICGTPRRRLISPNVPLSAISRRLGHGSVAVPCGEQPPRLPHVAVCLPAEAAGCGVSRYACRRRPQVAARRGAGAGVGSGGGCFA
ncbi:hypothetical protein Vse01_22680 [Micromonospora sediminimaris]|uniref:Uncharacterized protein n=1 Tax=Micromonospora sediminimaris TaxID=547162 RepID=A0A9W5UTS7_9ACTN|nr:hypothetical protein Vse01_22680 [Micromonospora sediminimaris]